jgi:hypothetical protein
MRIAGGLAMSWIAWDILSESLTFSPQIARFFAPIAIGHKEGRDAF